MIDDAHVGPEQITEVMPAVVTDPTGIKHDIYEIPTEGLARPAGISPGTMLHSLWLVDDETLKNGGGFACGQ